MEIRAEVAAAERRIRPWIRETPLLASAPLSQESGASVFLKLENLQHTGSFKARGAFSRLLALSPEERARGVISASTGNHGAAVAYVSRQLGIRGRVVVPADADRSKLDAIRALGAEVMVHGTDGAVSEAHARATAEREGIVYVSPYNDPLVVGGQGTIGVELVRQLPRAAAVYIALGGGGLLAGVAAELKAAWPGVRIIGASPERSAILIASIRAGRILDLPSEPTLSDGTAGGVEPGAITLPLCAELADELVTVSEDEIAAAMRVVYRAHDAVIEGAAGVAVAALLRDRGRWRGGAAVAVVCGGNLSAETRTRILGAG